MRNRQTETERTLDREKEEEREEGERKNERGEREKIEERVWGGDRQRETHREGLLELQSNRLIHTEREKERKVKLAA